MAGLRYVWDTRGMRVLLLVFSVINFFIMPVFVLLPFYVELRLGQGAAWYGFLLAPSLMGFLAAVTTPWVALALLVVIGTASGMINIFTLTLFQTRTPAEMRGRVLGLSITLAGGITPLGMLVGGVLGDLTDKNIPLIYAGCAVAAASSALLGSLSRDFREFLALEGEGG